MRCAETKAIFFKMCSNAKNSGNDRNNITIAAAAADKKYMRMRTHGKRQKKIRITTTTIGRVHTARIYLPLEFSRTQFEWSEVARARTTL